jgi:hypothetical protein
MIGGSRILYHKEPGRLLDRGTSVTVVGYRIAMSVAIVSIFRKVS